MNIYELIKERFGGFKDSTCLLNSDIIEYMVLEYGGCLNALKAMRLKCGFLNNCINNPLLKDDSPRSEIQIGFDIEVDDLTKRHLREALRKIRPKFSEYTDNYGHQYHNYSNTVQAFILLDKDIESAVKSSSLFIAAGDLSELDLTSLLELKENISLYKINDPTILGIVDELKSKISQHIGKVFDEESINKASLSVSNKVQAKQSILNQEQKFNDLFFELKKEIDYLKKKGAPRIQGNVWTEEQGVSYVPNPNFAPEYESVASAASKLLTALEKARDDFFNNPPSEKSLKHFQDVLNQAVEEAKIEFSKHRNIWDQLPLILKRILGVIAAITIIPALIVQIKSPRGFIGTFFETQKADSLIKLESFEKNVSAEDGVYVELSW